MFKGENKDRMVKIKWQDELYTDSRFIYYGCGTRNEFRITRFGKNFPWLDDERVGDLMIIAQKEVDNYEAWVLSKDSDIDGFLDYFNISPDCTNRIIDKTSAISPGEKMKHLLSQFISDKNSFPKTSEMALAAEKCYNMANGITDTDILTSPDNILLKWIDSEYSLFQMLEEKLYLPIINANFGGVAEFIRLANEMLNRRKSRAGKSLELHLAAIFDAASLIYEEQIVTEDNKRPDFVFPSALSYHDFLFPADLLVMLAAKTTCKDRWRQVINEANRIPEKHLFTLQQAISSNQLKEMHDEHVKLVVPQKYIHNYPKEYQSEIMDLSSFVTFVKEKQKRIPHVYLQK